MTLLVFICMVYVNFGDAETVPNFLLYGVNNVMATIVVDICIKPVLLEAIPDELRKYPQWLL
jgi:hypothetical protein